MYQWIGVRAYRNLSSMAPYFSQKYLDRIGSDAKGWYICFLKDLDEGKMYFLQNVGFNIVIIENKDVRYRDLFAF